MSRRIESKTSGGSGISTTGRRCFSSKVWSGGWGKVNMSLGAGGASERMNLWTRKSYFELGCEPARRTMSPSSVVNKVDMGEVVVDGCEV